MIPIRALLLIAALYDGLIGLAFLLAGPAIYQQLNIPAPNHWGYVHFAAALLVIFGLMFLAVAIRPQANRNLLPYGILLKVAYCGTVFFHFLMGAGSVPVIFIAFALMDLGWIVALAWVWRAIKRGASTSRA